jgi:hypothetical protein
MPRRLVTLVVPAVLFLAAPASAQTPPDERAAAQAFADTAVRAEGEANALEADLRLASRIRKCEARQARHTPRRHQDDADLIVMLPGLAQLGQVFEPLLTRVSMELHAVQTGDPALRSGRTAYRRIRRLYAVLADLPTYDTCAVLRDWARRGFRPTPTLRRVRRAAARLRPALNLVRDVDERLSRAARRMRELGVPEAGIDAFAPSVEEGVEIRRR